jgi:serine/threonine protein kinase
MFDLGCGNVVKLLGVAWRQEYQGESTLVRPCIVVEYSEIGTMSAFFQTQKEPIAMGLKRDLLQDVANALEVLSHEGIVHNDLKPDNVLIFQRETGYIAKASDFGHSIDLFNTWKPGEKLIPGDNLWAAPELLLTDQQISPSLLLRTDAFSFGLLAWWILRDGHNFDLADDRSHGRHEATLLEHKMSGRLQQLAIEDTDLLDQSWPPDVIRFFESIFQQTLSPLPEERTLDYATILHPDFTTAHNRDADSMLGRYRRLSHIHTSSNIDLTVINAGTGLDFRETL